MNCPRCGAALAPGVYACHACGTPITGAPAQPPYPYAAPYAPAYAPPPAYAANAGPISLKSGADIAFGVIAIIFGVIGLIFWSTMLTVVSSLLSMAPWMRTFGISGDYESIFGVAIGILVLAAIAAMLLMISGIIACAAGRGGGAAIASAVINILLLVLFLGATVALNSGLGAPYSVEYTINFTLALMAAWLFFVPALLVFIFLPVRASIRNRRVLARAAALAAAGMYGAGASYPPQYTAGYYPARPQPEPQPTQE